MGLGYSRKPNKVLPVLSTYTGRFAPSPTGPLHFGSLTAALASYLDAKAAFGRWLVRIEDIDTPRQQPGAADRILQTLEHYHLHWDGEVLYQNQRLDAYRQALSQLSSAGLTYPCTCTRQKLREYRPGYPGFCRGRTEPVHQPHGIRFCAQDQPIAFQDRIQGYQAFAMKELGDFLIVRKDKLFAYQLAVTVDDQFQGITDVVRGVDILDSTPRQITLQRALGYRTPRYGHLPVVINALGDKLSKQTRAQALPLTDPQPVLLRAMKALGLPVDSGVSSATLDDMLIWAQQHWQLAPLKNQTAIPERSLS